MPGTIWLAGGTPRDSTRGELLAERSVRGWLVVWALGRELRLRNQRSAACPRNSFTDSKGILPARGELAARRSESRRKLRRVFMELHRSNYQGAEKQHRI